MSLKKAELLVEDLASGKYFDVEYDSAQTIKGLTKIPVTSNYVFSGAPQYQLFSDAQKEGNLKIKETGNIEELEILNNSQYPVFIPCGSVFVGGKQDRTVIVDMLANKGRTEVPVACVERGRWSGRSGYNAERIYGGIKRYEGSDFAIHSIAPLGVARALHSSTTRNFLRSTGARCFADQGEVWGAVQTEIEQADAGNPTSCLTEVQLKKENEPKLKFEVYENEIGDIFLGSGDVLSMELYHSPKTWQAMAEESIKRYKSNLYKDNIQPKREAVDGFLKNLIDSKPVAKKSVGLGYDVRLTGGKVDGSCLVVSETPIHFTAMPSKGETRENRIRRSYSELLERISNEPLDRGCHGYGNREGDPGFIELFRTMPFEEGSSIDSRIRGRTRRF